MNKNLPFIPAVLLQPVKGFAGEIEYHHYPIEVLILENSTSERQSFGEIADNRVIIIKSPKVKPELGGQIEVDGRVFDLKSIQCCRNLQGDVLAYRCTVV